MSLFDALRYRFRVLTGTRSHEEELAEELEIHLGLDAMQREHVAHGALSSVDARAQAHREFGNVTYYREETRRVAGLAWMDTLQQDVRFALRSFRRTPTFTVVAVLTLAVGIGANTAIFSAVNTLLLRPLPFRDPEQLMAVSLTLPPRGTNPAANISFSYPKYVAFRKMQTVFSEMAPVSTSQFTIRASDEALRHVGEFIDSHYFSSLGVTMARGRNLTAAEDSLGAPHVVIVSDNLWRMQYNADPAILGRSLDIDGTPFSIVGVAPPMFRGLAGDATFWIPIVAWPTVWDSSLVNDPENHRYGVVARLKPGVTPDQADAVVRQLGVRVNAAYPNLRDTTLKMGARARKLDEVRVDSRLRGMLFILSAAVGLVLLIACANVANLFLVRAAGRSREIAVRLALGAGRGRIVRQLLVESVMLGLAGGLASIVVAWSGARALATLQVTSVLRQQNLAGLGTIDATGIKLDLSALLFTAALAIGTGLVFGLIPALQATRPSLSSSLQRNGDARGVGDTGVRTRRLSSRNLLVMVEISLAVVLLAGSGLMIRSLGHLMDVRPGFEASNTLTLRVNRAPNWSRDSISTFYDVAIARLSSLPGVENVAMVDCPPLEGCSGTRIQLPDRPPPPPGGEPQVGVHWVTPSWFDVAHVPILKGHTFRSSDRLGSRKTVLISESAARAFWPGQDPIGRIIKLRQAGEWFVEGVVGDVRFNAMELPPRPDVYVSYYQEPISYRMMLVIRTKGDPLNVSQAARRALNEVAPGFPVYDVETMDDRVNFALANARFGALLLSLFAALALTLATVGTYGVISFIVAQRTREIGLRVALGATHRDVVRMVVGQGMTMALTGAVIGLAVALAVTRVLRSLLYNVEPSDPATLAGIVVVLAGAVLAACWIPARRAAGISAMQSLRSS